MPRKFNRITCDNNGNFTYEFGTLHLSRGASDEVEWHSTSGPFIVSFERTPFDDIEFQSQFRDSEHRANSGAVRQTAELGIYKYNVAVTLGIAVVEDLRAEVKDLNKLQVWVDHCPETKIGR